MTKYVILTLLRILSKGTTGEDLGRTRGRRQPALGGYTYKLFTKAAANPYISMAYGDFRGSDSPYHRIDAWRRWGQFALPVCLCHFAQPHLMVVLINFVDMPVTPSAIRPP